MLRMALLCACSGVRWLENNSLPHPMLCLKFFLFSIYWIYGRGLKVATKSNYISSFGSRPKEVMLLL